MSMLKNLMVDTKTAWIEYPGLRGFEVELASMSRAQAIKLRKNCMVQKFNRKTRQPEEVLDEEKYVAEFTRAAIKNWKGLTLGKLEQLMLIDMGNQDPETEVPYSADDAETLVNNSADFDLWVTESVYDLENFRSGAEGGAMGSSGEVAE